MTIPNNHSKISVTAKLVAYFRQFSDIPFSQEIADFIGAEKSFQSLINETGISVAQLSEFAPVFEARHKSIVSLILKSGIDQVLELASGFSLRGFAMTRATPLAYTESDLEDLTAEKSRLISKLQSKAPAANCGNHQMLSANALDYEQLKIATREMHYQVDETPEFASVEKLKLNPQFVERLRPRLRVWVFG